MTNDVVRIQDALKRENGEVVTRWWDKLRQRSAQENFLALLTFVVLAARRQQCSAAESKPGHPVRSG